MTSIHIYIFFAFLFTSQKIAKIKGMWTLRVLQYPAQRHRQRDRHRDCKDHISFSLVEGNEQFNGWHATTTKSHWSFCKIIHTATSTIGLAVEYGATAAARVLSFYRVTRRHRDCHGRKAARILITSVTVALLPNNNLASPPRFPHSDILAKCNDRRDSRSLALWRCLFLAVQLLQRLEFANQRLVLILQQRNAILQASHVVLLFPATFFRCFSETTYIIHTYLHLMSAITKGRPSRRPGLTQSNLQKNTPVR